MLSAGADSRPAVLHLLSSFEQGGSERQALQLVKLLQQSGRYAVHVASLRGHGSLRPAAETLVGGIAVYPITSFFNANAAIQLRRFARDLRRNGIAVVQTHDFYSNVFGMAAAAAAGVPARIAARRETAGVRTRAQKVAERWAYRLAHAVVANAAIIGRQLAREGVPERRIHVVYNGVDPERVRPMAATPSELLGELGLPDRPRRFVTMVANMRYAVKNHAMFLRAAQLIAARVPDAGFLLVGEGELLPAVRVHAGELGLNDRVWFLGRRDEIATVLALSDVCVLTSRAEGFPNVILEYMAAGRPVVATEVGGVGEAVSEAETGYLVRTEDAPALAERVIALLEHPDLASAMGARARAAVERRFSCAAQVGAIETLYSSLLSPAAAGARHPVDTRS